MCMQCGYCYREHPYTMDDAIDAYESVGLLWSGALNATTNSSMEYAMKKIVLASVKG